MPKILKKQSIVLILIILEVTLWVVRLSIFDSIIVVLILIILEVTLWDCDEWEQRTFVLVLILIILEVTLWAHNNHGVENAGNPKS